MDIIYEKLELCVKSGANVVLSCLPIGDLATQYFADRGMFCSGRVAAADMIRMSRATGGKTQTTVQNLSKDVLGTCAVFEEKQVGDDRYNVFEGCPEAKTATIVLRGGTEQFIEESERSIHDAICVVKRTIASSRIVAGGGAIEMELSKRLKDHAMNIEGKLQLVIDAYAKALEIIPRQLSENAGFDSTNVLNLLRNKHFNDKKDGKWFGVDIDRKTRTWCSSAKRENFNHVPQILGVLLYHSLISLRTQKLKIVCVTHGSRMLQRPRASRSNTGTRTLFGNP